MNNVIPIVYNIHLKTLVCRVFLTHDLKSTLHTMGKPVIIKLTFSMEYIQKELCAINDFHLLYRFVNELHSLTQDNRRTKNYFDDRMPLEDFCLP